ncbi:MAG: calcium-binding protein, partial [Planctomycetota bacterium]
MAAHDGLIAAVLLAKPTTDPGRLVLIRSDGRVIDSVPTGTHPDMVMFTPAGSEILVANEGEPSDGIDPDGSVTVYQLCQDSAGVRVRRQHTVALGDRFAGLDAVTWLTPLSATPPSMVEPEFIACSPDGSTAFVSCQENNGIAVIDLDTWPPKLTQQIDLGLLDHRNASPIDLESDGILSLAH